MASVSSEEKSIIIPARDLMITWGDNANHWVFFVLNNISGYFGVEVASLIQVNWLEVHQKYDISKLRSGVTYEVLFKIELGEGAEGWDAPITVALELPNGTSQERKENFACLPRNKWVDLHVGSFTKTEGCTGEIHFIFKETEVLNSKNGLKVMRAIIRPITC